MEIFYFHMSLNLLWFLNYTNTVLLSFKDFFKSLRETILKLMGNICHRNITIGLSTLPYF